MIITKHRHALERILLLLGSLVLVAMASCNELLSEHYPVNNVIIQNGFTNGTPKLVKTFHSTEKHNVHRGLRDKKGNLWFGTTGEGAYRYDGNLFTQFTTKDGLSTNCIYSLCEEINGNIWFGTSDGVSRYDGVQFVRVPIDTPAISPSHEDHSSLANPVWSIVQSKAGKIWLGTSSGVYCYNGMSFSLFLSDTSVRNDENLHLKDIESILEDRKGNIWFGSYVGEGICFFDGNVLTRPKPNVSLKHFGHVRVMSILEDKHGTVWLGTGDGIYRYDGKNLTKVGEKAGINWVYSIAEDKNGDLWFATEEGSGQINEVGGVWRFDGETFRRFTTEDGLVHNGVFCTVEDQAGKLWFGTRNTGLSRYDGKNFTTFSE